MTSSLQLATVLLALAGAGADDDAPLGNPCADVAGTAQVNDCYTAAIKAQGDAIAAKAAALRRQLLAEEQESPAPPGARPWSDYARRVDDLLKNYASFFDAKCDLVSSGEAGGSAASNEYQACVFEEQRDLIDFLDGLTGGEDQAPSDKPLTP